MAKRIVNTADYTFNAAAKTITFSASYTGLELQHIELVTNLVDNVVIYQFNKPTHGGSLAGLVLTLVYDTTAMSNGDSLQIFVEADFLTVSTEPQPVTSVMEDNLGYTAVNTPTGELRTITPVLIVGGNFEGNVIDPNFWLSTVANSATNAEAGGVLTLTSGTDAAGSAQINSIRRARFIPNASNRFRGLIQISDAGVANNTRRWGVAWGATMPTITDGAYFQLSGTTFSVVTLKGGVATTVSSGSFNGDLGASYALTTNLTVYEIYYDNSFVKFVVGGVTLHTVSAAAVTYTNTVELHAYLSNINTGNTTSVDLACRVLGIVRLGLLLTQPISKYQSGTTAGVICKYGGGTLHSIAVSGVANNSVVTLYDNTAASGTVLWFSGTQGANAIPFSVDLEIPFFTGLTLVISGADSTVTVVYE